MTAVSAVWKCAAEQPLVRSSLNVPQFYACARAGNVIGQAGLSFEKI